MGSVRGIERQELVRRLKSELEEDAKARGCSLLLMSTAEKQEFVLKSLQRKGRADCLSSRFMLDVIGNGSLSSHAAFVQAQRNARGSKKDSELACNADSQTGYAGHNVDMKNLSDEKPSDRDAMSVIGLRVAFIEEALNSINFKLDSVLGASGLNDGQSVDSIGASVDIDDLVQRILNVVREEIVVPIDGKVGQLTSALENISYFKTLAVQEVDRVRQAESRYKDKVHEERSKAKELEGEVLSLKRQLMETQEMMLRFASKFTNEASE